MSAAAERERAAEIAAGLAEVRARIADACRASARDPHEVTLVVVTKTFPATDVRILAELGVTDVGENRDQEARAKCAELTDLPLRWHMIGQVQRKKARSVAGWADVVESVDRLELAQALSAGALGQGRELQVLIQVCLDPEPVPGRGGVAPEEVRALAAALAALPAVHLAGVMGVAPHPGEPRAAFARLAEALAQVRRIVPDARVCSGGMSGDLEAAIAEGATQVRIGGAILGNRPALR